MIATKHVLLDTDAVGGREGDVARLALEAPAGNSALAPKMAMKAEKFQNLFIKDKHTLLVEFHAVHFDTLGQIHVATAHTAVVACNLHRRAALRLRSVTQHVLSRKTYCDGEAGSAHGGVMSGGAKNDGLNVCFLLRRLFADRLLDRGIGVR